MKQKDIDLWYEISHYGTIIGDTESETQNLDMMRVRVYNLCGKLYWVVQINGDVIELKEIGKS